MLSRKEKGQTNVMFLNMVFIILFCMVIVVDFGRYIVLKNQTKALADSMALAAASSWDLAAFQTSKGTSVTLSDAFAQERAGNVFSENASHEQASWLSFTSNVSVQGDRVVVTVTGTANTIFAGIVGVSGWTATSTSTGRIVAGITYPIN
jgi:uncharacterized membrane protein